MVNLSPNAVSMLYNKQAPDGFEPWLQVRLLACACSSRALKGARGP